MTQAAPGDSRLKELFARAVTALRRTIPFDAVDMAILDRDDRLRVLAFRDGHVAEFAARRAEYSDALWNGDGPPDPAAAADRRMLDAGSRSFTAVPLTGDAGRLGVIVFASPAAGAFGPPETERLAAAAEFIGVAVERERLWGIERERHRRQARLATLLPTIAESLDVRKVFAAMSQVIQDVIPHDVMAFALITPDRGGVRIQAATHMGVMEMPEYRFSNAEEALDGNWQFILAYDLEPIDATTIRSRISPRHAPLEERVTTPGAQWMTFLRRNGIRSVLRAPVRSKDRPVGGVAFFAKVPDAFDVEDGVLASRIADHVALALAYQEMAEEARRIALAEERARALELKVEALSQELQRFSAHRALGRSAAWRKALADAAEVAGTDTTVLVTGESGTGKEVISRYIHRGSKRARGPFVALNCAALPEPLLESELFGHEKGAFTGAVESRAGRIEQAAGGVLFLDEVGEMSPAVQAKFLRVLQEREFQRVGGQKTIHADVRIVAATNRDPRAEIAAGRFREDLYYRLGVFEIHLPPLRERPEDVLVLAEAFLEEVGQSVGRPAAGLSEDARAMLAVHTWPGNVRELRNAIERAVILCKGGLVTREHLPITVARPTAERVAVATDRASDFPVEGVALDDVEKELVIKALARAGDNKSKAAGLLGISRGQLYSLLKKHGLSDAKR